MQFSDNEIEIIKEVCNSKTNRSWKITLALSPIICLASPYVPSRRGRERAIDRLDYDEAVLQFAIMWVIVLIGTMIWLQYKSKRDFLKSRRHFKKASISGVLINSERAIFSSLNSLHIQDEKDVKHEVLLAAKTSEYSVIGNRIVVDIEATTNTVLRLTNVDGG